jgi:succinate dehydrogenase hydrophobic anchor subunit
LPLSSLRLGVSAVEFFFASEFVARRFRFLVVTLLANSRALLALRCTSRARKARAENSSARKPSRALSRTLEKIWVAVFLISLTMHARNGRAALDARPHSQISKDTFVCL